jgi:hypothetical protein
VDDTNVFEHYNINIAKIKKYIIYIVKININKYTYCALLVEIKITHKMHGTYIKTPLRAFVLRVCVYKTLRFSS